MKYVLLGIFVACFVAMPLYLLSMFVMPELNGLEQTYAHADQIANRAAGVTTQTNLGR